MCENQVTGASCNMNKDGMGQSIRNAAAELPPLAQQRCVFTQSPPPPPVWPGATHVRLATHPHSLQPPPTVLTEHTLWTAQWLREVRG